MLRINPKSIHLFESICILLLIIAIGSCELTLFPGHSYSTEARNGPYPVGEYADCALGYPCDDDEGHELSPRRRVDHHDSWIRKSRESSGDDRRFPSYCYSAESKTSTSTEPSRYGLPLSFLESVTELPNGSCMESPNKCIADLVCTVDSAGPEGLKLFEIRHMNGEYEGPYHVRFQEDISEMFSS